MAHLSTDNDNKMPSKQATPENNIMDEIQK